MDKFLKLLKKYCTGFICVYKLKDQYTGAIYRIFIDTDTGPVTIFWYDGDKFTCKGKRFLDKIASNGKLQAYKRT